MITKYLVNIPGRDQRGRSGYWILAAGFGNGIYLCPFFSTIESFE